MRYQEIKDLLGEDADSLLEHKSLTFDKSSLVSPSEHFIEEVFVKSNRGTQVLKSLQSLYSSGRLKNTGYLSILPVDQGIEHSAGSAFAPNPKYFDPENIVKLAMDAGCSAVASTFGVLGILSRQYAHKIPFIVKINHNDLLSYPTRHNQKLFGSVREAWNLGAVAIGATVYFGSENSREELEEISEVFEYAHELGMATILWCYVRNSEFTKDGINYERSADLTGQANYLGCTVQADIIKQKLPKNNGGFVNISFGKSHPDMYDKLSSDNPIDLCRYQVANCYMGKVGLINSGGASKGGADDIKDAVFTAVVNKRAGGQGLILGRKAFQKSREEGVSLINAVQDVYLEKSIDLA